MSPAADSPEDLRYKALVCRRMAAGMGSDPTSRALIEIAEEYEARAAALQPPLIVIPDQPA